MKKLFILGFIFSSLATAEPLYKLNNKTFKSNQLSPRGKQALYHAQKQQYQATQAILEAEILIQHVEKLAAQQKKTREEIEINLLKSDPATDQEAKQWFTENQARLGGRPFDSIKTDIKELLSRQSRDKVRKELIEKLKISQKFKLLAIKPTAPYLEINSQGFPSQGNSKAKIQIVEFADYKCPHCKEASAHLKEVLQKFKDKVHFTYMDFPLNPKGESVAIAQGAYCAQRQDKFWDYHRYAFSNQNTPNTTSAKKIAESLKLDLKKFDHCMSDKSSMDKVFAARKEGERIGIQGTPAIYINGRRHEGHSSQGLMEAIKKLL